MFSGSSRFPAILLWALLAGLLVAIGASAAFVPLSPVYYVVPVLALVGYPFLIRHWSRKVKTAEEKTRKLGVQIQRLGNKTRYYESILQDSTDIILTIDRDGFILKFNKGAEANLGYGQMEIVGKPFHTIFMNRSEESRVMQAVSKHGSVSYTEAVLKTNGGEAIFAGLSISPMRGGDRQSAGLVVTCKNITEKKKLEQELMEKNRLLEELAITDSLTGLYNSRHFYESLKRELARLRRQEKATLSLMMIDVDHFKTYNDTHGHQAGDQVLRVIGQLIQNAIRKDVDSGYRYGGDEFTVILPNTDREQAERAAQRIQTFYGGQDFAPTSLSIGLADTSGGVDVETLVKRADQAMYEKKKHRR